MFEAHLGPGIDPGVSLPALAFVGLGVGCIAGMFGMGGGFLLVPVLMYVFGIPAPLAVGSALCQTCGMSLASFLKYRHLKRGEPRIALVMLGGSLMGVDAGTRLLLYLIRLGHWRIGHGPAAPAIQVVLGFLFVVLLSGTACYMTKEALEAYHRPVPRGDVTWPGPLVTCIRIPPYIDLPCVQLSQVSAPIMGCVGFAVGMASGLMGIGGGILLMPVLLYGFGISLRNAAGTGILLLFVTALVGTVEQALHGNVSLALAMVILIGSSIGSQIGALITHYLPNRTLRLIFVGLIVVCAVMIAGNLWRMLVG